MVEKTDIAIWLEERLGSLADSAGWTIARLPGGGVEVVGRGKETAVLIDDVSRSFEDETVPCILITEDGEGPLNGRFWDILSRSATAGRIARSVAVCHEVHRLRCSEIDGEKGLKRRDYEVEQLVEIGKSISAVRDIDLLLSAILEKARFLAGADAGSIYVVEGEEDDIRDRKLRFKLSQNDSIEYEFQEYVIPVSTKSIAGAAAIMRQSINIPDVKKIPKEASYGFDSTWDERTGYMTKSVLAVPMINLVGDVLGVVQLINKKSNPASRLLAPADFDREVIPMDARSQELVETLASQAGVAMENAYLYAEIKRIFEGFVRAAVHAIEQRDPTTSGHSFRVAALSRRLAEVVHATKDGPYAGVGFSADELREIETAALLHDFGKVGIREEVLVKAKKLYAPSLKMIRARFDFICSSIENDYLHRRLMMMDQGSPEQELEILDQASKRAVEDIEECWRVICSANEPTVLPEGDFEKIVEISNRSYFDIGGNRQSFLSPEEVKALKVAKGSLTEEELEEIRSHVVHTISFLNKIPWGKAMKNIPAYAGAHHEKLNGTGYPYGLKDQDISLPSKIMAVADIFDALTASDRPYKKAVSVDRALSILELESKDRHIDGDLVRLFREAKVYGVLEALSGDPFSSSKGE